MAHLNRREFLQSATIGGATIVLASIPAVAASADVADAQSLNTPSAAHGPMVAYIGDLTKDEIHVLVGTTKVVVHNRRIVAQLARAAR